MSEARTSSELENANKTDFDMIQHAWDFAVREHGDQKYGGTEMPYRYHLAKVAQKLLRDGHNAHVINAGILHDVLENVGGMTVERLYEEDFSYATVRGVVGATIAPEELALGSVIRKLVVKRAKTNSISWVVKHADSTVNLEAGETLPKKIGNPELRREKYDGYVTGLKEGLPTCTQVEEDIQKVYGEAAVEEGKLSPDDRDRWINKFETMINDLEEEFKEAA